MDIDNIVAELNKHFQEPLPEFHQRRLIFWQDDEGEFLEQIRNIELDNAKILILEENNSFVAKKLLAHDDTENNYLVYRGFPIINNADNYLLDMELYSGERFQADMISIWLNEMHLPSGLRKFVKKYRKFFNAKARRNKITALNQPPDTEVKLYLAIMASICGTFDQKAPSIVSSIFSCGLEIEENDKYQALVNYGADEIFWTMAKDFGYYDENPSLKNFAKHILITACSRTLNFEFLKGLEEYISYAHQSRCYDFVTDWIRSDNKEAFRIIANFVEDETNLVQRFRKMEVEDLQTTELFPCLNHIILEKIMADISSDTIKPAGIRDIVEKRRTLGWYSDYAVYFDGLVQLANMQEFHFEYNTGFHAVEPQELWKLYTEKLYIMDSYYRKFHVLYAASMTNYNPELDDLWNGVKDKAEGIYVNWFLNELSDNWSKVSGANFKDYGKILDIPAQVDFYKNWVKPEKNRVIVIISDAMRYEIAASLTKQLQQDTQCEAKLSAVQSIFPSITKFGMAALLPHNELTTKEVNGSIELLADGYSTASGNRDKVLKSVNEKSIAVRYEDIVSVKRAERSALLKGMEVVYIYHDRIDAAGHTSDTDVFGACDIAIDEIKNLIKILVNDIGATRILVTADHGFLHMYSSLTELDKISRDSFEGKDIEAARRYVIAEKGVNPEYMMPMLFMEGRSEYTAFSPKGNIRLKIKGAGLKFVHGGVSLQEIVVPVVEYHYLRNQNKKYQGNRDKYDTRDVGIKLLTSTKKVSNMIFSLGFYQDEAIAENRKAAEYKVYFVDKINNVISDVQTIIADRTQENAEERQLRCRFNLKSLKFNSKETYYLIIADKDGMEVSKTEFQIDIPFAVDDFGFF